MAVVVNTKRLNDDRIRLEGDLPDRVGDRLIEALTAIVVARSCSIIGFSRR